MKRVCMLGAGAWGTAVSTLLAANGFEVALWCYEQEVVETIKATRINGRYLPGIQLDEKIKASEGSANELERTKAELAAAQQSSESNLKTALEANEGPFRQSPRPFQPWENIGTRTAPTRPA